MPLDTWVSIGSLLAIAVGIYTPLRAGISRIERELGANRTELKGDIAGLDDRVYALGVGLRPRVDEARSAGPAA